MALVGLRLEYHPWLECVVGCWFLLAHRATDAAFLAAGAIVTDPKFAHPLLAKSERAIKHIGDLENVLLKAFPGGRRQPYGIRFKDDLNTQERTYYVESVPEVPLEVTLIVGDVLQNLRSALDHLACHLIRKGAGTITSQSCFPIAGDAAKYVPSFFHRKIEGMRQEAKDAIHAIKPYKGGNDALWRIHELNKIDKHRLLLTACSTHIGRSATPSERTQLQQLFMDSHPGQSAPNLKGHLISIPSVPLKAGDKLCTIHHSELEQDVKFLIDVALDEPQIIECQPVIKALYKMSVVVTDIVLSFDRMRLL